MRELAIDAWRINLLDKQTLGNYDLFAKMMRSATVYHFEKQDTRNLEQLAQEVGYDAIFSRWVKPKDAVGFAWSRSAAGNTCTAWESNDIGVNLLFWQARSPPYSETHLDIENGSTVFIGSKRFEVTMWFTGHFWIEWGAHFTEVDQPGFLPPDDWRDHIEGTLSPRGWPLNPVRAGYTELAYLRPEVTTPLAIRMSRPERRRNPAISERAYFSVEIDRGRHEMSPHWVRPHPAWYRVGEGRKEWRLVVRGAKTGGYMRGKRKGEHSE